MESGSRLYVYCISYSGITLPDGLTGLAGMPVRSVKVGRLAAVVSDIEFDVVRPERRYLSAHQAVLTKLTASADLLPMAFGMISENEEAVSTLLFDHAAVLMRELARVTGRVEMTVRLRLQNKDAFSFFVERYPELRKQRDACFSGQREPAQKELLDLGRTFEDLLIRERESKTNLAVAALSPTAVEMKTANPNDEGVLFDINFLVDREHEARFDSSVEDLAKKLGDEFLLEVRGPWPAYNFVNVSL